MHADWYEDPLGRYDGRFFDGEMWTAEVSTGGVLATDPDFPPAEPGAEPVAAPAFAAAPTGAAVAPVDQGPPRRASTLAESPVRTVAVLDEALVAGRSSVAAAPATNRARRWFALAAVAAIAALLVFFMTRGDDTTPDLTPVDLDRVEDLEAGGLLPAEQAAESESLDANAPVGPVQAGVNFGPGDEVQVGAFRVANGAPFLTDLAAWHRNYAAERDIVLGADTGCWFGQLVDAAVQVVSCGPVAGQASNDYVFDLVPVAFEDGDDGRQVAIANIDGVTPDAVLANALVLVAHPDGVQPPAGTG